MSRSPSPRKYGLVAYPQRPPDGRVKASPSASIIELMASMNFQCFDLLSEPHILPDESSSGLSDTLDIIASYPIRRRRSLINFVSFRTDILFNPLGTPSTRSSASDQWGKIIISAPTAPRLRAMLREVVNVSKWRDNASGPYAPGHIPWSDLPDVQPKPWIFEGSILSADEFKFRRDGLRFQPQLKTSGQVSVTARPAQVSGQELTRCESRLSDAIPASTSLREALVFEREITSETDGQSNKRSSQVPPNEMNTEIVCMMLESHEIDSCFVKGLDDDNERVRIQVEMVPPTLVLSNSTLAIPLSLDSSPNLAPETPLAVRRGKKLPPALNLKDQNDLPYPSIPTAFLGSPSTHSPKFEYANYTDEPSMDLDDMVANLRSQCASLGSRVCPAARIYKEESCHSSRISMASFSEEPGGDEWAFADNLMNSYSDKSFLDDFSRSAVLSGVVLDLDIRNSVEFDSDTSASALDSTSPKASTLAGTRANSHPRPRAQNFLGHISTPPPTIPLPRRPALSPAKPVRGILKSTKSVRFASLPNEDAEQPVVITSHISLLPSATLFNLPRRSMQGNHSPARPFASPNTTDSAAPATLAVVRAPSTRRASESSALRPTVRRPSIVPPGSPKHQHQPAAPSPGRFSMGARVGKENRPRSSSATVHPSRFVLDEKSREKGGHARDLGSKSRMPIAVRNIFTRFK